YLGEHVSAQPHLADRDPRPGTALRLRRGEGRPQGAGLFAAHARRQAGEALGLRGEGGPPQLLGDLVRALQAGAAHPAAPPRQVREGGPGGPGGQHRRSQDRGRGPALRRRPQVAHAGLARRRQQGPRALQPAALAALPPGHRPRGPARLPPYRLHERHRKGTRGAGRRPSRQREDGEERVPMSAGRIATALVVLLALLPSASRAQKSLRVTNTTLLEYRGNNENGIDTD